MGLTRYLDISLPFPASRPPPILSLLVLMAAVLLLALLLARFTIPGPAVLKTAIILLIIALAAVKIPSVAQQISIWLRSLSGQSTTAVVVLDFRWLGFSYIAFRLLHTFRDRQSGRLPAVSLGEYVVYVIFFPAWRRVRSTASSALWAISGAVCTHCRRPRARPGKRLLIGLFKKFAVADTLALIALNATNALQVQFRGLGLGPALCLCLPDLL